MTRFCRVTALALPLVLRSLGEEGPSPVANDTAAAYRQAHACLTSNRYTEAAALFATATSSTNAAAAAAAWLGRGEALYGAKQWGAAAAAYDTLLKNHPDSPLAPSALCARGFSEVQSGQLPQAHATFTSFTQRYPNHALAATAAASVEKLTATLATQARQQAVAAVSRELSAINAWFREGAFDDARAAAERFLLAHPDHPQSAELRFLIATCAHRSQDFSRAAEAYRTFLDGHPQHARAAEARVHLADCLLHAQRFEEASALYEKIGAETADPVQKARSALAVGDCRAAQLNWAEAERLYLSVEVLYASDALRPVALKRLAGLYESMGQHDKAARCRDDLARRFPGWK